MEIKVRYQLPKSLLYTSWACAIPVVDVEVVYGHWTGSRNSNQSYLLFRSCGRTGRGTISFCWEAMPRASSSVRVPKCDHMPLRGFEVRYAVFLSIFWEKERKALHLSRNALNLMAVVNGHQRRMVSILLDKIWSQPAQNASSQ